MQPNISVPLFLVAPDDRLAVQVFDSRFGEMERVLWYLPRRSRDALLAGESSPVLETLGWTVKSWWGVQGVPTYAKSPIARALARLEWSGDVRYARAARRRRAGRSSPACRRRRC
jgi:hypothetical protein